MAPCESSDGLRYDLPVSRTTIVKGYAVACGLLLLAEACASIAEPMVRFSAPRVEIGVLPVAILFSAVIAVGLSCGRLRWPKRFPAAGPIIACVTAAYSLGVLAMAAFGAWIDFDECCETAIGDWFPRFITSFFGKHDITGPFALGFWAFITPPALVALACIVWLLRGHLLDQIRLTEGLALTVVSAGAGCFAFVMGSMMAVLRTSSGDMSLGPIVFRVVPVVLLGALTAWAAIRFFTPALPKNPPAQTGGAIDIEKVLSSASQTSIVTLVLLYICVSQTSGYASRLAELVEARKAFASDVLYRHFQGGRTLDVLEHNAKGEMLTRWASVDSVPWGSVRLYQYAADTIFFWVEVSERLSKERWSARVFRSDTDQGRRLQEVADRHGVRYEESEGPIKIYPRIDAALRSKEVALPGTGFSLDLTSFTLLAPFIVFAALVLLGYRAKTAVTYFSAPRDPWILLDADKGLVGLLAWLWLGAIAFGPWLLSILVVQAIALTLRARGSHSLGIDALATAYVVIVLVVLIASTASAVKGLIALRSLAKRSRGMPGEPGRRGNRRHSS
jgi:hypothetical protein